VNGTESERLRRALGRLVDGQREALEVIRRALDGDTPAEGALVDLEDILQGALDDARAILGVEEGDEA
jgi:HPt (histidine-containing phosphotransfer) domain-containing protein